MTDTPKQARLRRKFEASRKESAANLAHLRAAFVELERANHPRLPWAREELRRVETAHEVLTNTIETGGDIDPAELRTFLRGAKGTR
jgi:hypothetical protein